MAGSTSPQAKLPTFISLADEIKGFNNAKPANINPPRLITLSGASDIVFDCRPVNFAPGAGVAVNPGTFIDQKKVSKLILHNLGTHPIYYSLNQAAKIADGGYHDVLAGGSVALDGLGSLVDLSEDQPNWVTVIGTAGDKLAVVISYGIDVVQN